jgi:hypothetical protein
MNTIDKILEKSLTDLMRFKHESGSVTVPETEDVKEAHDLVYKHYNVKELQHHKDTTVGLWATDRPDLIPEDIKHLFFQIK